MKRTVLVAMVLLLATILSPVLADRITPGAPDNSPFSAAYHVRAERANRLAERTTGFRPEDDIGPYSEGYEYRVWKANRLNERENNRGCDDRDYGYQNNGRGRGNGNRTSFSVGVGARIGGVGVNLGYSKTTYSKPKTSSQKPPVVIVNNPPVVVVNPVTNKCQMSLVSEVAGKLETISPIVVTNPEKTLVTGTRIVFSRNGEFLAEYEVLRVSGDTVSVETIDAPRGNPRQGDTFSITSAK